MVSPFESKTTNPRTASRDQHRKLTLVWGEAAERARELFIAKAKCSTCHVPPAFAASGWNMHKASEVCVDDFQANRARDHAYRTHPERGSSGLLVGGAATERKHGQESPTQYFCRRWRCVPLLRQHRLDRGCDHSNSVFNKPARRPADAKASGRLYGTSVA